MLKHGEVNPLNVYGLRQIEWCPPHFEQVVFDPLVHKKVITDWLYENLEGRFYIGDYDAASSQRSKSRQMLVAFEIANEASYFSFYLSQINIKHFDW